MSRVMAQWFAGDVMWSRSESPTWTFVVEAKLEQAVSHVETHRGSVGSVEPLSVTMPMCCDEPKEEMSLFN